MASAYSEVTSDTEIIDCDVSNFFQSIIASVDSDFNSLSLKSVKFTHARIV